jgi:hypothetical protein
MCDIRTIDSKKVGNYAGFDAFRVSAKVMNTTLIVEKYRVLNCPDNEAQASVNFSPVSCESLFAGSGLSPSSLLSPLPFAPKRSRLHLVRSEDVTSTFVCNWLQIRLFHFLSSRLDSSEIYISMHFII